MEPYTCRNGDYFFLVTYSEIQDVANLPLEAPLLLEGDKLTGKVGRLSFEPKGDCKLRLKRHPDDLAGWNEITAIELILNRAGRESLDHFGLVVSGGLNIDLYVKEI